MMRALISLAILSLMATAASAQSPINRALIGCWTTTTYDVVHDDREITRDIDVYRSLCFRDDGDVIVTSIEGGCGQSTSHSYVLWGNTLSADRDYRFRISHLGTRLTLLRDDHAETYGLSCRESDGAVRCPALFEKLRQ
jgi:hypothetical protein